MSSGKKWRTMLSISLLILIIGIAIFFFIRHREDFRLITTVSVWPIVLLILLKLILIYFRSREIKIITDHFRLHLNFSQWFGLSRLSAFTNLWLPSLGGTSLKAVYLKKQHDLRYTSFITSTAIAVILKLMVFGSASILLLLLSGKLVPVLLFISGAFVTVPLGVLVFGHRLRQGLFPGNRRLASISEEWRTVRNDHTMIRNLIVLSCTIYVLFSLEIYLSFKVFSIDASVLGSGIIAAFTVFSNSLRLIPANLGLKEAIFVAIADLYGTGVNEGLHAAAFHRIVGTVFILALTPGFVPALLRRRKEPAGDVVRSSMSIPDADPRGPANEG